MNDREARMEKLWANLSEAEQKEVERQLWDVDREQRDFSKLSRDAREWVKLYDVE